MSTIHARFRVWTHSDDCEVLTGGECDGTGCGPMYFGVDAAFFPEPGATLRERVLLARHAAMQKAHDEMGGGVRGWR